MDVGDGVHIFPEDIKFERELNHVDGVRSRLLQ